MPLPEDSPNRYESKVMEYRNLDLVEGCPGGEIGDYNFYKAAEELSSKYGSSEISDKGVIIDWEYYEVV